MADDDDVDDDATVLVLIEVQADARAGSVALSDDSGEETIQEVKVRIREKGEKS